MNVPSFSLKPRILILGIILVLAVIWLLRPLPCPTPLFESGKYIGEIYATCPAFSLLKYPNSLAIILFGWP